MSKKYNEMVQVHCAQGRLQAFIWRKKLYTVREVIGVWTIDSGWWQKQPLQRRHTVVSAQNRYSVGVFELYCEQQHNRWVLHRVLD